MNYTPLSLTTSLKYWTLYIIYYQEQRLDDAWYSTLAVILYCNPLVL